MWLSCLKITCFSTQKHYKFGRQHQKSTHPSPSPLNKKIKTLVQLTKFEPPKTPHLYIYIYLYIYLHCALRRVQAVAGHFAWSQLCGPQEGLAAADAHGLATRDDATGGRGLGRRQQQFGGVRCPEAEASADARSFGGLGVPLVSGCFGLSFWSIPREVDIHIKHLFLEKKHHLLQFLCLWGEGIC